MGFGSVAAQIIMFISLLSVATGLVVVFDQHSQKTTTAMVVRSNALANTLQTDFVITNVKYNETENFTIIDILNTGSTELPINNTDVLINGLFVPRDENKTLDIIDSTEVRNPLLWDPNEVLEIRVNATYAANLTHTVDVISTYGVRESSTFSWG